MHFESSKIYQSPKIKTYTYIKTSNMFKNFKFPYCHPLNQWLLAATNGNQGPTLMHF